MLRRLFFVPTLAALAFIGQPAHAKTANGSVELKDPAGNVKTTGEDHGLDLVNLSISSDGEKVTLGATLKGSFQGFMDKDPVVIYADTDNNATTGAPAPGFSVAKKGFEYALALSICAEYESGYTSCGGGSKDIHVAENYCIATAQSLTGGHSRRASESPRGPVAGEHIEATLSYTDLGVKPGQTIRLVARENHQHIDSDGFLPEVLLTLK